jgi:hypothetical protein
MEDIRKIKSVKTEIIVKNFIMVETTSGRMLLAHAPVGFTDYLSVENEDSYDDLAPNGFPRTQGGINDMGAYPYPQVIDGGTY